jgi:arylsulfatase A-like enzyme
MIPAISRSWKTWGEPSMHARSLHPVFAWLVALVFGLIAGSSSETAGAADTSRPNILFLFSDDQSTRTIGCYPESWSWVRTPNIDKLAQSGIRFTHCYLGSWCMPSRANLLTGRYPHAVQSMRMEGTYPGSTYDTQQCPFWPRVFRQHGYHTAQIGKWHTGTDVGYGRDWDYQIVWNRPKNPDNAGSYYAEQIVEWNGKERTVTGYSTDNYTNWACDYIRGEGRDKGKPWFLWLCYGAIHGPSTPAPRHKGQYKAEPVEPPADIFPPRPTKPAYLDKSQAWSRGPNGEPVAGATGAQFGDEGANRRTYADWVRQVNECNLALDEGIGRVMETLRQSGQLENTLVVWTADQGFAMGEHGFRHKLGPYDANYNSPLVVSFAGKLPEGKVCKSPVCAGDLITTFFSYAGLELPWKMHGRDITPLLKQPEAVEAPRTLLYEHMGYYYGSDTHPIPTDDTIYHNNVPRYVAIRYDKYKYIRYLLHGEMEEIYDLEADPQELTNLALKPENRGLLAELRQRTIAELRRTEAPFADAMPPTLQMQQ